MPLQNHFRPPLDSIRRWESFHSAWAVQIMRRLNRTRLMRGYTAEVQAHVGPNIQVDVGAFESLDRHMPLSSPNGGGVATLAQSVWTAPTADQSMPAIFPAAFEVQVFSEEKGAIVAAIELISPANKDRPETRGAFVAKCAAYLHNGVGLVIADIVTSKSFNLHNELVEFLGAGKEFYMPSSLAAYAVAYRPVHAEQHDHFELWKRALAVGQVLPDLPLPLGSREYVQLELELTYNEACLDCQIG